MPENFSYWKRLRHQAEAMICGLGFSIFPKIPYSLLVVLSHVCGKLASKLARSERKVAEANLKLVFPDWSPKKRSDVIQKCFVSFARTGFESMASRRLIHDGLERRFEFTPGSLELLKNLTSRQQGLIALTFHYGNWEWLSLAWAMAGYPLTAVSQPIKNPVVEELFRKHREQLGHRLLHRQNAGRLLFKALKRKETIGLLVDLNSSPEEGGDFFDFFGLPAMTTQSVGFLALRTGAPIVCSVAYPTENRKYAIEIGPEITYQPDADAETEGRLITQRWISHCETLIRRHPEFWMWMYKRWKTRPHAHSAGYPFYSFYLGKTTS